MLVPNPQQRASLSDLLNHPWMTRGFNGPPDHHLLQREPLRAAELDRHVIRGMTGFEFGTEEEIEHRLVAILESEAYKRAVQHWESRRERPQIWSESSSNSSLAIASPSASQSQPSNAPLSDFDSKESPDPTRGYHPLISIYYLAREKLERDRVYGLGHFASSQLSLNPPQPASEEVQAPPPSASKQSPLVGSPP